MPTALTDEEVEKLRHSFRRCREGTADAIVELRRSRDVTLIPGIVMGVVWRYVNVEMRPRVEAATAETPLASIGIDSLTMMEVVLDVQDALDLVVEDEDLKQMKTIGEFIEFLQARFVQQPAV